MLCQSKDPYVLPVIEETLIAVELLVAMTREGIFQSVTIGTPAPAIKRAFFFGESR